MLVRLLKSHTHTVSVIEPNLLDQAKRVEAHISTLVYAEKSESEKDHKKNVFNCTQRAHQVSKKDFRDRVNLETLHDDLLV